MISFYQVAATLGPVYGVRLHEDFTRWTDFIDAFRLDLLGLTYPDACIGPMRDWLLLATLWPVLLVLLGGAALACHALAVWLMSGPAPSSSPAAVSDDGARGDGDGARGGRGTALDLLGSALRSLVRPRSAGPLQPGHKAVTPYNLRRDLARNALRRLLYWAILVAYLALPSVSRSIFKAKQCKSFNIDDVKGRWGRRRRRRRGGGGAREGLVDGANEGVAVCVSPARGEGELALRKPACQKAPPSRNLME